MRVSVNSVKFSPQKYTTNPQKKTETVLQHHTELRAFTAQAGRGSADQSLSPEKQLRALLLLALRPPCHLGVCPKGGQSPHVPLESTVHVPSLCSCSSKYHEHDRSSCLLSLPSPPTFEQILVLALAKLLYEKHIKKYVHKNISYNFYMLHF